MILISCKVNQNSNQTSLTKKKVISNYISENFNKDDSLVIIPNNSNNFILYNSIHQESEITSNGNINFFIYDKSSKSIIYNNNFSNATIQWFNDNELLLTQYLGIIESKEKTNIIHSLIDVKTGKIKKYNQKIIK